MRLRRQLYLCAVTTLVVACGEKGAKITVLDEIHPVTATMETAPVQHGEDAADDPCIWVHPSDPARSTIIGTDKQDGGGLLVYDLQGKVIQFTADGSMNNVDIRYNFPLNGESAALVTTGNRSDNTIAIYRVDPESRRLEDVAARKLPIGIEVYGSCMYRSPVSGHYYTFINDKDGTIEQWRLYDNGSGAVDGELVRTMSVDTQPEGCVADDIMAVLYIGEEEAGIWKFGAEPEDGDARTLVDSVGVHIVPDVEGLTIYYATDTTGYLIASSQGNDTYVIYQREGNNAYVGTFQIVAGDEIDGTSDTDGIDIANFGLGPYFPNGLFVAQDGSNPGANQNYKCVRWDSIARLFDPPLVIDTSWDPRLVGLNK
ncbi:MAG: phytase [Calditrichaeota bacterium]|nr:phytase [Calditrichota bacterium]